MRSNGPQLGRKIRSWILCGAIGSALLLSGCNYEKLSRRLSEQIERYRQGAMAICNELEGDARTECIQNVAATYARLNELYFQIQQAIIDNDTERIKALTDAIRDLIRLGNLPVSMFINSSPVLEEDDSVWIDVLCGISSGGQQQAAGEGASPSPSQGVTYSFSASSGQSLVSDGLTVPFATSGSFAVPSWAISPNGTRTARLSSLNVTMNSVFWTTGFSLLEPANSKVTIAANGVGSMIFKAEATSTDPTVFPIPEEVWMRLPVYRNADGSLRVATAAGGWRGTEVFPIGPWPVADHDRSGVVNLADQDAYLIDFGAGSMRADVTGDNVVDQSDLDYFTYYFELEMQ